MSKQTSPLTNKTILITGASDGIGLATALGLARLGAHVVIHGRNPDKCQAAIDQIQQEVSGAQAESLLADLSELSQVRRMAGEFLERYERLDVLVNNAGAVFLRRQLSADGYEMSLAVNHLSHFLLTNLLLPRLEETATAHGEARVVVVSSGAHRGKTIDFNDLQMGKSYRSMHAYGVSKLANLLFAFELARRLQDAGVTVNALHPGFVASNIGTNNSPLVGLGIRILGPLFALSPEQGAQTSIYLASSPEVEGSSGAYYAKCQPSDPDPIAHNREIAARLWAVSQTMVD